MSGAQYLDYKKKKRFLSDSHQSYVLTTAENSFLNDHDWDQCHEVDDKDFELPSKR